MRRLTLPTLVFLTTLALAFTPAASAKGKSKIQPPNSGTISVAVNPPSAQVQAGAAQQFTASVSGSTNQTVLWSLAGPGCQGIACGYMTGAGYYRAPATPPNPPTVVITALSLADSKTTGSATVTIGSKAAAGVTISPNLVQLNVGGRQQFTATVTGSNTQISWSVSGPGCGYNCGTISPYGLYTAPSTIPVPNTITVTAQVGIFPVVTGTATVTIQNGSNSGGSLTVSPNSIQLSGGGQQTFSASLSGVPTSAVSWSLSGVGCSGSACGTISTTGSYSAPAAISSAASVTVTATTQTVPPVTGTATVSLIVPSAIQVTPQTAQVPTSGQQQFSTGGASVAWSVSCGNTACGSVNAAGLYTAPATVPFLGVVYVTAQSLTDFTQKSTATVTITSGGNATVSISPSSNVQVNAGAQQQFAATVNGPSNTAVTWNVTGPSCSGAACGAITQSGLYTAPVVLPFLASVTVTATSQAVSSASASVTVQLTQSLGISLSPYTSQMTSGTQQQFSATVTGNANTGVTWSVTGSGCFLPGSCGVISSTGLYTAPSGVTSPTVLTVTATAQANPSKTASATITVVPVIAVSVSPATPSISVNAQQQFTASVSGATNSAVQWSVTGTGCSGAACGTIVSSSGNTAFYQAPPSIPASGAISVIATSVADNTKSGLAAVTIVSTQNSKLSGRYAFTFGGFDGSVNYQAVGTFVADGNGNITNGIEDINCGPGATDQICRSAPYVALPFSGTYSLNADNRGSLTISSALPTTSRFAIALAAATGDVRFIESDGTGVRGSGVMKPQILTSLNIDFFDGSGYAIGLVGVDATGGRIGMIGNMVLPAGTIASPTLRVNDRVAHNLQDTTYLLSSVGGNFTVDATSGRGTMTVTAPGLGSGTLTYGMYIVSRGEFFLISEDLVSVNPMLSGQVLQAQLPTTILFFQKGNAVISWSAINGGVADVALGTLNFANGSGLGASISLFDFDENNGGTVTVNNMPCLSCSMLTQPNDEYLFPTLGTNFHVFPFGLNSGFVMGSTPSVQFGKIESQTQSLAGTLAFGSDTMLDPATPLVSGTVSLSLPNVFGNEDLSQQSGFTANLSLTGNWPQNLSGGTGTISLSSPNQQNIAYWIVSYAKVLGLDIDSGSIPDLLIFEQ